MCPVSEVVFGLGKDECPQLFCLSNSRFEVRQCCLRVLWRFDRRAEHMMEQGKGRQRLILGSGMTTWPAPMKLKSQTTLCGRL
jgi:hypothetical protein